jgi:hypothetical protein
MMIGIDLGSRMIGVLGSVAMHSCLLRKNVDDVRWQLSTNMLKFEGYIQIHDGEEAR